jgi:hypothetical protein
MRSANSTITILLLSSLAALPLSGCTVDNKSYNMTSICGHSPGGGPPLCCAIGPKPVQYSFNPNSFSCTQTQAQCANAVTGSDTYRYPWIPGSSDHDNTELNTGCQVTWAEKAILAGAQAIVKQTKLVFTAAAEPLDCRKECDYDINLNGGGSPDKCPAVGLNADVAGALLDFYSTVDPSSYPDDVTIVPLDSIASSFNVPNDQLKQCARTDVVVHKNGLVQNIGADCPSHITSDIDGAKTTEVLSLAPLLSGRVTQSDKDVRWMEYDNPQSTFSLIFDDSDLNKLWGGPISRSGMLLAHPVGEVTTQFGKICVRADPPLMVSDADQYLTRTAPRTTLKDSMQVITKAIAPFYDSSSQNRPPYPGITFALNKLDMKANEELFLSMEQVAKPDISVNSAYIESLANWMDAALCNEMAYRDGHLDRDFLRAFKERFIKGQSPAERNAAYANLLRCAFAPRYLSADFQDALKDSVAK